MAQLFIVIFIGDTLTNYHVSFSICGHSDSGKIRYSDHSFELVAKLHVFMDRQAVRGCLPVHPQLQEESVRTGCYNML